MDRWKNKTLMHVWEWSIKVFSLVYRPVIVVLAVHNMEIILKTLLYLLNYIALRCIWVNWLPPFPVVLISLIEETMISNTIAWDLVNILHLICVLMHSASLIKEFLILCMVKLIILWVSHVCPIIPSRNRSRSRHVSTVKIIKSSNLALSMVNDIMIN